MNTLTVDRSAPDNFASWNRFVSTWLGVSVRIVWFMMQKQIVPKYQWAKTKQPKKGLFLVLATCPFQDRDGVVGCG